VSQCSPIAFEGVPFGAQPSDEGVEGGAYYFNGGSYLSVPGLSLSPATHPYVTIGAWVKPDEAFLQKTDDPPW
jgi:hypothetical protein